MTCVLFPTLQVSQSLYLSLSLVSLSFYLYPFYSPHRKLLASLFLSSLSTSISCGDHRSSPPTNHELLPTSYLPFLPVNSPSSSPLFLSLYCFPYGSVVIAIEPAIVHLGIVVFVARGFSYALVPATGCRNPSPFSSCTHPGLVLSTALSSVPCLPSRVKVRCIPSFNRPARIGEKEKKQRR